MFTCVFSFLLSSFISGIIALILLQWSIFSYNIDACFLIGYQHETELLEESLALPRFLPFSCKFGSSEDEFVDLDEIAISRPPRIRTSGSLVEANAIMLPTESVKQEYRQQQLPHGWLHKMVPLWWLIKPTLSFLVL